MPRLTEQEQQEIIRFLEADKPLPEKYRFLLFDDKREVELVWNGKTNEVCNIVLPFQVIEQVDEPRKEKSIEQRASQIGEDPASYQPMLFDLDERGRQLKGWTNKLIWGDNKLILSSLKNGPLREEIEQQGGIKLIYIDPPFDVGADFSMDIEIGDETFTKKPNILEEIAYRDTWGKGADSFLAMIYERLVLMRDLLADDGSIYVHCDWRVQPHLRQVLDEVFGPERFLCRIVWKRSSISKAASKKWLSVDELFFLDEERKVRVQYPISSLHGRIQWRAINSRRMMSASTTGSASEPLARALGSPENDRGESDSQITRMLIRDQALSSMKGKGFNRTMCGRNPSG